MLEEYFSRLNVFLLLFGNSKPFDYIFFRVLFVFFIYVDVIMRDGDCNTTYTSFLIFPLTSYFSVFNTIVNWSNRIFLHACANWPYENMYVSVLTYVNKYGVYSIAICSPTFVIALQIIDKLFSWPLRIALEKIDLDLSYSYERVRNTHEYK